MTSKSITSSKSFIPTKEILDFSSRSATRQKYVTCSAIRTIATAYNDRASEKDYKFDLGARDSDLRTSFFTVYKSIDLDFVYNVDADSDEQISAACNPATLLTSNGYKCNGLLKVPHKNATVSPSTDAIVNALNSGASLKDSHGASTIDTQINDRIEVLKTSSPSLGVGPLGTLNIHDATFNVDNVDDISDTETSTGKNTSVRTQPLAGELSMVEIKNCLNNLITTSNEDFDKITQVGNFVTAAINSQNELLAVRNRGFDEKIDECQTQVAVNTLAIEKINTDVRNINSNFARVQTLLGFDNLELNVDDETLAANLKAAVGDAIEDSVNRKIDEAIVANPNLNPCDKKTPAECFASAAEEVRNRVSVVKNEGGLRVAISNTSRNTYIKVQPEDDTENFDTRALAVLLSANFSVVYRKLSPGQPTIWIRVNKGSHSSPREAANAILEDRVSYAGKAGISWAINVIDDITARLLFLKRRQVISNFKIGKSGYFFADLNDGDQQLYESLATVTGSELKAKRNEYIKSCTSIKIEVPQQFKLLDEDIILDSDKMKLIKERKAFYWSGEFHEFTQSELKKFSKNGGLLSDVTAAMGTRDLKWK